MQAWNPVRQGGCVTRAKSRVWLYARPCVEACDLGIRVPSRGGGRKNKSGRSRSALQKLREAREAYLIAEKLAVEAIKIEIKS